MSLLESDSDMCSFHMSLIHFASVDLNEFVYIGRVKMESLLLVKCRSVSEITAQFFWLGDIFKNYD